jgi:hypothetical protein
MKINENLELTSLSATYMQPSDGCDDNDLGQDITIKTETQDLTDFYYVIETKRWAFNDAAELQTLLDDFTKRLNNE